MTPPKDFTRFQGWKPAVRKGGMYLVVAGILAGAPACSSTEEQEYETVVSYEPTQGVLTQIEETSPGEFAIVDEQTVPNVDDSRFIVKKLDGSIDTFTREESRKLITPADTVYVADQRHYNHSLGSMFWWGAGGYMLGRMMSQPVYPYAYRDERSRTQGMNTGTYMYRNARQYSTQRAVPAGRSGFFGGSRSKSSGS